MAQTGCHSEAAKVGISLQDQQTMPGNSMPDELSHTRDRLVEPAVTRRMPPDVDQQGEKAIHGDAL